MKLLDNRMAVLGLLITVIILALFLPRWFRGSEPPAEESSATTNAVAPAVAVVTPATESGVTNAAPPNPTPSMPGAGMMEGGG